MLTILYPISFFISLSGLIMWFYYQENREMSKLMSTAFLGGFFVYLLSLAFADAELSYKMLVLIRDLFILGIVSQFFNFFAKNKTVFIAMLIILFAIFQFGLKPIMQNTFPQQKDKATSSTVTKANPNLDTNGELLVEVSEHHKMAELQSIIDKYGLTYEQAFNPLLKDQTELDDYVVVNVPDGQLNELKNIKQDLLNSGLIDWVEENEVINLDPMESKAVSSVQKKRNYGINDPELGQLWGFDAMEVDKLYSYLKANKIAPKKKATIAILDTGVDAKHEDIKAKYSSIKSKYDKDPRGHGTHCAGIAAAVSNNKIGVASFSPNNDFVSVSSITVLGSHGSGTQKGIIDGIILAADKGADVISMSLGGMSTTARQKAYEKAVKYANKAGTIVIVAAGNSNANATKYTPANVPGVITVSAIDEELNRAVFSNWITDLKMGIAAPGVNIYSTIPDDKYASFNGTSMATPYVSGLVGLMKSIKPSLTTAEAYKIIKNTGKDTKATKETGKLIQPSKAIEALTK